MKRKLPFYLRSFLVLAAFLMMGKESYANHILGMDLSYTWVSGSTYKITLTAFGDCANASFGSLSTATPTICVFRDGTTFQTTLTLALEAPTTGTEITPVCASSIGLTTCTSPTMTIPGVKKFVYSANYTVPSASTNWRFIFNGTMGGSAAGRASTITNITGPGSSIIQLIATLNNSGGLTNSSPVLTVIPTPYYCLNNDDNYNPGAIDANGDSLRFSLVPGKLGNTMSNCTISTGNTTYITASGYSATSPLHYNAGTFSFDPATGQIQFNPDVTQNSLVIYNIQEYRGGVLVGSSQREMSFLVQTCANTPANGPISLPSAGTVVDSTHYQICQNSGAFSFHIKPTETNISNRIKIISSSLPAGSSFNVVGDSTNAPDGTFSWTSTGTTPGTYTFFLYFLDDNCPIAGTNSVAYNVTISPIPTITGVTTVCAASTTTLSSSVTGGTWSSASPGIATIGASSGIVTGTNPGPGSGTSVITYVSPAGCLRTTTVTVNPQPAVIAGATSVCVGSTIPLSDATAIGTWSSSAPTFATVTPGPSQATVVTGVSGPGTTVITYRLSSTGCARTTTVTVNIPPATITGTPTVCVGFTTNLSNTVGAGVWTSSNTSFATVNAGGLVTGVGAGSPIITYTSGTGCFTTQTVTVNATPLAITPSTAITLCIGNTVVLSSSPAGGTWSSSTSSVATINNATRTVTGVGVGSANITYMNAAGCFVTKPLIVNTSPTPILPNPATLCTGATSVLSNSIGGGVWSVGNTAIATITPSGTAGGVAVGNTTVTYSIGSCTVSASLTVNPAVSVSPITGPTSICVGGTTITLSDPTPGGTWTSGSPGIASISAATRVVTGISAGTAVISYAVTSVCGTAVATHTVTVSTTAGAGVIVGPTTICAGTFTTLTSTVPGGTWSVSNANATITSTGLLTGITAGTVTISYSVINACGSYVTTKPMTIGAFLTAGTISGPTSVCAGSAVTLSDNVSGGVWSSTNSSVATISGFGVVSGVSAGTTVISYLMISGCGSAVTTYTVTVNPLPAAGTIIGPSAICAGSFTFLSNATLGGVWSSTNSSAATISTGGLLNGVSAGTTTISYTFTNSCGTAVATLPVTVNPAPSITGIVGPSVVCVGTTIALTDVTSGGVWSSSNTRAVVSATGIVTGVATGADTIIYSVTIACGTITTSKPITVNPALSAGTISGPSTVCVSSLITLTASVPGGVWSSSNGRATITTGGIVTGIMPGLDTISYTVFSSCGTVAATKIITVVPTTGAGAITGPAGTCPGNTFTLSAAVPGGVWSVSNTAIATISATGVVTGVALGTDTVFYTITSSCGTNFSFVVIAITGTPSIAAITGPTSLCIGTTIALSDATPGGTWSSGGGGATVSSTGIVTGISASTVAISYTITNACGTAVTTHTVSVVTFPVVTLISGPSSVCVGSTIALSNATPGGTWTTTTANASVSSAGVVTGVTAGADIVTYLVSNACGTVGTAKPVTVNPVAIAGSITGPDSVCAGSTIVLVDLTPGGVWSSGNTNATVVGGTVTGVAGGTVPISYSVTNICGTVSAVKIITVVPAPNAGTITGPSDVCVGSSITLVDLAPGGTWLSSNSNATFLAPGILSGVSTGLDTVFYLVNNACGAAVASKIITINPVPVVAAISGPTSQCVGTIIALSDPTPGGQWFSGNPAIAATDLLTGVTNGVGAGIVNITYTVTNAFGCPTSVMHPDTVIAAPPTTPITGSANVCVGSVVMLSNATAGGVWSNDNTSVATIDPVTGMVTGLSAGSTNISYTLTNICGTTILTTVETVDPLPAIAIISGPTNVCAGSSITLSDAVTGGAWSSDNTTIAVINTATGVLTGVNAGFVIISYTVTSGLGCSITTVIGETVDGLPTVAAIDGSANICIGTTALLSDATAGGTWSSSNTAIATVDPVTGMVTGVAAGTATISYSVTSGAGCTASATIPCIVSVMPTPAPITGIMTVCEGATTALSDADPGGAWSNTSGNVTVSVTGVVTGVTAGTDIISYTVTNACGAASATATITILPTPVVNPIGALYTTVCSGSTVSLTETSTGGVWSSSNTTIATVSSAGVVSGITVGSVTITYTVTSGGGCTGFAVINITVGPAMPSAALMPLGSATLCDGNPVFLHVVSSAGGITYQWLLNGAVISGETSSAYTTNTSGTYTVIINNGVCSQALPSTVVVGPPLPVITFVPPNTLSAGSFAFYQWYLNGILIPGATSAVITITTPGDYTIVVTDANGCTDTSAAFSTVGINTITKIDDIKVYPNPATSVLHIDAPVKVNISVLGIDGKLLISQKDAVDVNVHDLANGMYIIMIYDEQNMVLKTAKFAKSE